MTRPQMVIMELLDEFQCLKISQIEKFISLRHGKVNQSLNTILKQLRVMGKIRLAEQFVYIRELNANHTLLTVFDIMLDLTEGSFEWVSIGDAPFVARFATATETVRIVLIGKGEEKKLKEKIKKTKSKNVTEILLLEDSEQQKYFQNFTDCYFAIKDTEGDLRYFQANSKNKS